MRDIFILHASATVFRVVEMWSTDFGETNDDAFDGQQQQQHVGTQQAYASPGVGVRLDDVQTTETPRDPNVPPPYQPPNEFA